MSRDDITLFTDFDIPTKAKKPDKTIIEKPNVPETFGKQWREQQGIGIEEYELTMNDFSQRFLVAAWDENENFATVTSAMQQTIPQVVRAFRYIPLYSRSRSGECRYTITSRCCLRRRSIHPPG